MLALPLRGSDRAEVVRVDAPDSLARYRIVDVEAYDSTGQRDSSATLEAGVLRSRLLLSGAPMGEYAAIPLAHIVERRADGQVVLDEQFMPTVLNCRASGRLWSFVGELLGMMRQRGHELSGRVTATGRGGAAEIADFLMLLAINRFEPVVAHMARATQVHPQDLYLLAVQLAGELATFTADSKRCEEFPPYQHENLRKSFEPVMKALRLAFGAQMQQVAVPITVGQIRNRPGFFGAPVADPGLFEGASFVLAVRADVPHEDLRRTFPLQAKIGSPDQIQSLVSTAVPGITLNTLPVAPRQIPYHAGFVYFELDGNQRLDLWERCRTQSSFAFHVGGNWPGLMMEFWAIRG
jgi:type VI secretion system protein ImpJ